LIADTLSNRVLASISAVESFTDSGTFWATPSPNLSPGVYTPLCFYYTASPTGFSYIGTGAPYSFVWTSTGGTPDSGSGQITPLAAMGAWGSTRQNLQYELGGINEQVYADPDNLGQQGSIIQYEQDAFNQADTTIQLRLAKNRLANTALTVTNFVPVQTLKRAETKLACAALCRSRGQLSDDGKDVWGATLKIKEQEAEDLIWNLINFSLNSPSDSNAVPPSTKVTPSSVPRVVRDCVGGVWGWWLWGPYATCGVPFGGCGW
jgi:hypothetical protein